ncbi:DNA circularization N-terminal domain-containing protein [Bradyrhizobium barranii subsp. apii]|uniref:DNA circularization N-terminal domain-containing protein n=1 Tax=Bradyrhizobium barranii TaxID=2992140 RepID=UPI001AA1C4F8|nr:DNA circularization N-terminal domain-containing protein [Bradyrhizobium barranii]UPT99209.1 DNA circularization N-terminal domain-containing protein [Bradyrhizobium barranii subsp. apii]
MVAIRDVHNPWRDRFQRARFRSAIFYVDTDVRGGGRRTALHEYPKRNTPYAEDMGRAANKFVVQGFLITRDGTYLQLKDELIEALEQDGPGMLRLPLPYMMRDVEVMVQQYSITESRERGGMCMLDMTFVEYGSPVYRATVSTSGEIGKSASNVESNVIGQQQPTAETSDQAAPYAKVYDSANTPNNVPNLP